jgi:exopolysaccharide biosynthesis WecB/TagA/CpsF family protein
MTLLSLLSLSSLDELFKKTSKKGTENMISHIMNDWKSQEITTVHFVYFANIWKQHLLVRSDLTEETSLIKNQRYRDELMKSDILLPDGIAFRLLHFAYFHPEISRWNILLKFPYFSQKSIPNMNGTDFVPKLLNYVAARKKNLRVVVYGSKSEYSQKIIQKIQWFWIVDVVYSDGYAAFDFQLLSKDIPCMLLVWLGSPKQEEWVATYRDILKLHSNQLLVITVGGLFDFFSWVETRAPVFLRKLHLEWLWRSVLQPKKNLKKTLVSLYFFWVLLFVR